MTNANGHRKNSLICIEIMSDDGADRLALFVAYLPAFLAIFAAVVGVAFCCGLDKMIKRSMAARNAVQLENDEEESSDRHQYARTAGFGINIRDWS